MNVAIQSHSSEYEGQVKYQGEQNMARAGAVHVLSRRTEKIIFPSVIASASTNDGGLSWRF